MKRLIPIPLLAFIALTGCENLDFPPGASECLEKETKEFKKKTSCDNGNSVKEYKFQDKIVYVLFYGNCTSEPYADVLDSDCNKVGYIGGLVGNTKINGTEFSNATFIRTIWEN